MSDQGTRKKWNRSQGSKKSGISQKPRAQDGYEQYLAVLQERNRILKKLRQKDSHQVEMEKKEQGFALYLNGANFSHRQNAQTHHPRLQDHAELPISSRNDPIGRTRTSKTAGSMGGDNMFESSDEATRAKTAPSKRKSWSHADVKLRAAKGEPIHVEAPGILSGKYKEDFEPHKQSSSEHSPTRSESSVESEDEIMVGFEDISILRESLEADDIIKKSISEQSTEESCPEELEEDDEEEITAESDQSSFIGSSSGIILTFGKKSFTLHKEMDHPPPYTQSDSVKQLPETMAQSKKTQGSDKVNQDNNFQTDLCMLSKTNQKGSVTKMATQSLSAVVRKKDLSSGERLSSLSDIQKVLEAVQAENEEVRKASQQRKKIRDEGLKAETRESKMAEGHTVPVDTGATPSQHLPSSSKEDHVKGEIVTMDQTRVEQSATLVGEMTSTVGTLCGNTQLQQASVRTTPMLFSCKPATLHPTPALKSESGPTSSGPQLAVGGEEVSCSLTEKTLKVITEKVRSMNAKQQQQLLDLLGKLDNPPLSSTFSNSDTKDKKSSKQKSLHDGKLPTLQESWREMVSRQKEKPSKKNEPDLHFLETEKTQEDFLEPSTIKKEKDRETGLIFDLFEPAKLTGVDLASSDLMKEETSGGETSAIIDSPKSISKGRITDLRRELLSTGSPADKNTKDCPESTVDASVPRSRGRLTGLRGEMVSAESSADKNAKDCPESTVDASVPRSSSRMTGLRGEMLSAEFSAGKTVKDCPESTVDASGPRSRGRMTGLRGEMMSADSGRRMTGLRGELMNAGSSTGPVRFHSASGSYGRRTTGLRGKLLQEGEDELIGVSSSQSDPHLLSSLDNERSQDTIFSNAPRLKTAVLAKGNRPLMLGATGSDTCLLPVIGSGKDEADDDIFMSKLSSRLSQSHESLANPTGSQNDPKLSFSHYQPVVPSTRLSIDDCLASVSKFDQSHLGQMGANLHDDILETFLSEYRQKKQTHLVSNSTTPSHSQRPHQTISPQTNQDTESGSHDVPPQEGHLLNTSSPENFGEMDKETNWLTIPELPIGRELVINILSTWGDRFYVGLTGIEIYTASGAPATIKQVAADPMDINVLPEYSNDPRVVTNLLDGVNHTRDDLHMWLTPFTHGMDHLIYMQFSIPYALAMIRIWNYNKSRIHSSRGARHVEMFLDGHMIFSGEVAQASGVLSKDVSGNSETILFTVNEDVLHRVSQYDPVFQSDMASTHDSYNPNLDYEIHRPKTADLDSGTEPEHRPFTTASLSNPITEPNPPNASLEDQKAQGGSTITGSIVQIVLASNWGDLSYMGLTGIELLEADNREPILLRPNQLILSVSSEEECDECGVEKLLDGVNVTTDATHMWVCPVPHPSSQSSQSPVTITFTLDTPTSLLGLRVWNYNATMEDSYKGVKLIHVYIDGSPLQLGTEGADESAVFLLRRAPGHVQFNFSQDILFQCRQKHEETPSYLPRGFVFQFQLFSAWGDPYYIGLNGLELYDGIGGKIPLTEKNIAAFPDSVNILPEINGDLRTPDKLVDGVYDTMDGRHMWLAPVLPGIINSVFVIFDEPQTISLVKLWNYCKSHNRGVKEFALLVDDLLVFTGTIPATPTYARGILPTLHPPLEPFTISFQDSTLNNPASLLETREGDVQFINNKQVISASSKLHKQTPSQDLRPLTSLTTHHDPKWWQ